MVNPELVTGTADGEGSGMAPPPRPPKRGGPGPVPTDGSSRRPPHHGPRPPHFPNRPDDTRRRLVDGESDDEKAGTITIDNAGIAFERFKDEVEETLGDLTARDVEMTVQQVSEIAKGWTRRRGSCNGQCANCRNGICYVPTGRRRLENQPLSGNFVHPLEALAVGPTMNTDRRRAMRMGSRANRGPKRTSTGTGSQEGRLEALDSMNTRPRPGAGANGKPRP